MLLMLLLLILILMQCLLMLLLDIHTTGDTHCTDNLRQAYCKSVRQFFT